VVGEGPSRGNTGATLRVCGRGESLGNIAGESPECSGFKFCQFSDSPDDQEILCIHVFPGLWLRPSQLWQNNLAAVLETLQTPRQLPEQQSLIGQKSPQRRRIHENSHRKLRLS
jgi:hypothetical protein